ncbi:MAG: outer membrane beta-barrel protein [Tannerellaceae bacterium]|jgi:opacity protein-like surface antigen|nr:outer membrane beta-barrel protein [Tannerellaceae bacterium]
MKRVLFLTVLFVAGFSCVSFAQFEMSIGPAVGINYNFYNGPSIRNSNMSYSGAGVSLGGQADMKFNQVVGLLTSITLYDMMSASGSNSVQGTKTGRNVSLSYLMVNPSIKFTVPNTGLGFFGGPGVGFKIGGSFEDYRIVNGQREQLTPVSDLLNLKSRINAQIGMSYDFDLKGMFLSPYFLYDLGLTDVDEAGGWKASGIKVGLAIKFNVVK